MSAVEDDENRRVDIVVDAALHVLVKLDKRPFPAGAAAAAECMPEGSDNTAVVRAGPARREVMGRENMKADVFSNSAGRSTAKPRIRDDRLSIKTIKMAIIKISNSAALECLTMHSLDMLSTSIRTLLRASRPLLTPRPLASISRGKI